MHAGLRRHHGQPTDDHSCRTLDRLDQANQPGSFPHSSNLWQRIPLHRTTPKRTTSTQIPHLHIRSHAIPTGSCGSLRSIEHGTHQLSIHPHPRGPHSPHAVPPSTHRTTHTATRSDAHRHSLHVLLPHPQREKPLLAPIDAGSPHCPTRPHPQHRPPSGRHHHILHRNPTYSPTPPRLRQARGAPRGGARRNPHPSPLRPQRYHRTRRRGPNRPRNHDHTTIERPGPGRHDSAAAITTSRPPHHGNHIHTSGSRAELLISGLHGLRLQLLDTDG